MLEKETYTQRYLAEKQKYDTLLAKVNSTSTLGSVSIAITDPIASGSGTFVTSAEAQSVRGPQTTDIDQSFAKATTPGLSTPASTTLSAGSPRKDVTPILPFGRLDGTPPRPGYLLHPPPVGFGGAQSLPAGAEAPEISVCQATVPPATHREKMAKAAKAIAKWSGYVVTGIAAVIFFPITIFILVRWLRQERRPQFWDGAEEFHSGEWDDGSATYNIPSRPSRLVGIHPHEDYFGPNAVAGPYATALTPRLGPPVELDSGSRLYQSVDYRAELPGPHELYSPAVEMDLMSRLTKVKPLG